MNRITSVKQFKQSLYFYIKEARIKAKPLKRSVNNAF